ncbi:MAG TPA: phosphatidylserine decarboxylase family protein [Syntrophorhabdaceae bacterium]|nr:phosphatidylserine decarboxylase family protein [Syntrophorhabdaceae bacterium]HPP06470.1 phosphatidylserine decarboxylase family protein [Syntrophorhabdaceae bacterium]
MKGLPFAREGYAYMGLSLFFTLLLFLLNIPVVPIISLIFFLFCLYFFRNPKRFPASNDEDVLISPADGKVIDIKDLKEDEFLNKGAKRLSIFMSLSDVHVNRSPCHGTIKKVIHKDGEFALAFKKDIEKENERNYILIENGDSGEDILVVQIAGFIARRITSYVREGMMVRKGEPIGIIAFGSRVDIYFPQHYKIMVSLGSKVKAGMTIIAKREVL